MFEKIEAINLDRSKEEKPLETINELSIHETDLLEKAQEKIPEEKRGKFEKMKKAFLAITAGAMLLSATGCGYPFIMQRAIVSGNLDEPTMAEIFLGPAAYPIDVTKDAIKHAFEVGDTKICFYNNEISLNIHYKKPFLNNAQINIILNRISSELEKDGWIKTEDSNYGKNTPIYLNIDEAEDGTFFIDGYYKIDKNYFHGRLSDPIKWEIIKEDLLKNIKEYNGLANPDKPIR
ncbi:MAG: hypothetical protein COX29_02555 [Candidatus Moranbacteria bacterium CG23_combo_of_CG06-09_8_20_14_all_35_22]|nr:MAG: hypothetical protein COX29_02555 [Candidatus Moranbacteria bacterium CG23_combo_of_CG06-09_8_20_14_all_35_22]